MIPNAATSDNLKSGQESTSVNIVYHSIIAPQLIELKSGETYSGILASCDSFMNVHMVNAICTSKRGDEFWKLDECFIRGNNVKSFRLPEEVADLAVEDAKGTREFSVMYQCDVATARPSTSNSRARGSFFSVINDTK
ncbi:U6 snRNA-associated Sm-like protein LSm4, putative [Babesia bigemina]|uniref:U6 snRNA-associated Sm-like protein LSm4 n=1 Tax=Babesia bigemina TaxID=5866 RepID=A0A061DBM4_BABBI|nr:U6 snRNA-associated Sm-like protein LSm4, putative [Babesia bigemina]CDR98111.1 U6 snRNA-associated Sm-like protein LSm4, putative [Babesia bigemina]|eukprot:XP_012770297.1 U6 snRNA-associated Sm-like protein LSm4, putative [Babesia bigemina]